MRSRNPLLHPHFYNRVVFRSRGYLPHWEVDEGLYFVTFRLADSLPAHVYQRIREEACAFERTLTQAKPTATKHVHVLMQLKPGEKLDRILCSWKSYTGREANRLLRREGTFWQKEYFDRRVRNELGFENTVSYVLDNPRKAGLIDWPWLGGG